MKLSGVELFLSLGKQGKFEYSWCYIFQHKKNCILIHHLIFSCYMKMILIFSCGKSSRIPVFILRNAFKTQKVKNHLLIRHDYVFTRRSNDTGYQF